MSKKAWIWVAATAAVAASLVQGAGAASRTEIVYGKTIAERYCAGCHQVSRDVPVPPPVLNERTGTRVAAPNFMAIAADRRKDATYLRSLLTLPPYPMPDRSLPSGDIPYLMEYIQSLRAPRR